MEDFMTLNAINFADVARREKHWVSWDVEESFITMKLISHGYLVSSLGICVHETPTKTGLRNGGGNGIEQANFWEMEVWVLHCVLGKFGQIISVFLEQEYSDFQLSFLPERQLSVFLFSLWGSSSVNLEIQRRQPYKILYKRGGNCLSKPSNI